MAIDQSAIAELAARPQIIVVAVSAVAILISGFWFSPSKRKALNGQWQDYKLTKKTNTSPNTSLYHFALAKPTDTLGLPIGQHIQVDDKMVSRSYTPVSSDDDKGFFELLIKGKISQHMDHLKIGDKLSVKGPSGKMKYDRNLAKKIGMLAGGTGITPMLQIIRAAMKNSSDTTHISLIYANVKPDDILVKDELDDLAKKHPKKFEVYYFLNEPPSEWQGGTGFVTKDEIKKRMPAAADDIKIMLCGPPPMIKAMTGHLVELGYEKPRTISKIEDQVFSHRRIVWRASKRTAMYGLLHRRSVTAGRRYLSGRSAAPDSAPSALEHSFLGAGLEVIIAS